MLGGKWKRWCINTESCTVGKQEMRMCGNDIENKELYRWKYAVPSVTQSYQSFTMINTSPDSPVAFIMEVQSINS